MLGRYFTCVENVLLEYIMKNIHRAGQIKVLLCIIRFTNGFHREEAMLSTSFIARYTGLTERSVMRDIHDLEKAGIIFRKKAADRNIKVLRINPSVISQADKDVPASYDKDDTVPYDPKLKQNPDTDNIQEINNKYNNINNKREEISLASYGKNLQNSINEWTRVKALDYFQQSALLRIVDKYTDLYGEDAVSEIIDQCIMEGRSGIYFDRLNGEKRQEPRQSGEALERITWDSIKS